MTAFIGGAAQVAGEMLSPHFSRAEFEHSDTAVAHGIENVMNTVQLSCARSLCWNVLEPIRQVHGIVRLSSGFRCPQVNALVGSKPGSQHLLGQAADIHCDAIDNFQLALWISQSNIDFDQVILEAYHEGQTRSGWVHVSRNPARTQRRQVLTIPNGRGTAALVGLHK